MLVAIEPATTGQFIRHGAARHLTPPTVGQFRPTVEPTVEPTVALAATLAAWLELLERPVALAPPLLHSGQRWGQPTSALPGRSPPSGATAMLDKQDYGNPPANTGVSVAITATAQRQILRRLGPQPRLVRSGRRTCARQGDRVALAQQKSWRRL